MSLIWFCKRYNQNHRRYCRTHIKPCYMGSSVMIQTIKQIKISEIVAAIQRMGVNQDTLINLTIETIEEDILTVFNRIGKEAQAKGLTEEILEELLADES